MRTRALRPLLVASMAFSALFGCTKVDSQNLKTSGIRAFLSATGTGSGSAVASAEFQVDDSALAWVELKNGDQVTATTAGQTLALEESDVLGVVSYARTFDGAGGEGTTFTLSLARASNTSAPNTVVTLPAPFNVTAPTGASLSYSRANDDIVVTYDNSGLADAMSFTLDGPCINPVTQAITGDPGTFTVPKGTIAQLSSASTNCPVTLTVLRTRAGTLDSAYAGGSAYGAQARMVGFTSTP